MHRICSAALLLALPACAPSGPEVPVSVNTIEAVHTPDGGGDAKTLKLDGGRLMACLQSAKKLGEGEAHKCALPNSDYTVKVNGGELVITVHTSTQFTIDNQGFFEAACLYTMLHEAAYSEPPKPGGC